MVMALLIALSAQLSDPDSLPDVSEVPYSAIERELDKANEKLVQAQTYTCQQDAADEAYAPVSRRFDLAVEAAREALGRQPNLDIWLNSCRKSGDGPRFRALLAAARRHVRKADKLIDAARRERTNVPTHE